MCSRLFANPGQLKTSVAGSSIHTSETEAKLARRQQALRYRDVLCKSSKLYNALLIW